MLGLSGGAVAGLLLAGCGSEEDNGGAGAPPATTTAGATSGAREPRGIVFNTASRDVTLFDPAENRVTARRPTNAAVRWLSNEQHYFDGRSIWTYDYPEGEVQAIAIDPESFEVTSRIPVGGGGPGHSLVLSPDNRRGFVNSAGSDFLAVVDPEAGEMVDRVELGAYPWDVDLSPDGRFGYIPERDQDTVAKLDTGTLEVVDRAEFPEGSRPWMLRAATDREEVWVQTASGSNTVLDARTLETLYTEEVGSFPVTVAWPPDGRYGFVSMAGESYVAVLDSRTGRLVKSLEVGQNNANVSFRPDGRYGYVAVTGENAVAVVDVDELEVTGSLEAGEGPMGLILL